MCGCEVNEMKRLIKFRTRLFHVRDAGGQALVETALFLSILGVIMCAMTNLAYLVFLEASVISASHQAVVYEAQGLQSPTGQALPALTTACSAVQNEVEGWLNLTPAQWGATAASADLAGSDWAQTTSCGQAGYATKPTFQPDPEGDYFTIDAVSTRAVANLPFSTAIAGTSGLGGLLYGQTVYFRQQN